MSTPYFGAKRKVLHALWRFYKAFNLFKMGERLGDCSLFSTDKRTGSFFATIDCDESLDEKLLLRSS